MHSVQRERSDTAHRGVLIPIARMMHHPVRPSYIAKRPPKKAPAKPTLEIVVAGNTPASKSAPAMIEPSTVIDPPMSRTAFPRASILHCGISNNYSGLHINTCFD